MPVPRLYAAIAELDRSIKFLLEWMPVCSKGSSGHLRRIAVEKALLDLEHSWAAIHRSEPPDYDQRYFPPQI